MKTTRVSIIGVLIAGAFVLGSSVSAEAATEITLGVFGAGAEEGQEDSFNVALLKKVDEADSEFTIRDYFYAGYDMGIYAGMMDTGQFTGSWQVGFASKDMGFAPECYGNKPLCTVFPVLITLPETGIETIEDLAGKKVKDDILMGEIQEKIPDYNEAHSDNPLEFEVIPGAGAPVEEAAYSIGESCDALLISSTMIDMITKYNPDLKLVFIDIPDADELWKHDTWIVYSPVIDQAAVKAQIEADIDKLVEDGTYASLSEQCYGLDHSKYYPLGESAQPEITEGEPSEETSDKMPEDVETEAKVYTDQETVKKVQQALNNAGFSCGTPDGAAGNMTNSAIIEFKTSKGMDASNADITDELLKALELD